MSGTGVGTDEVASATTSQFVTALVTGCITVGVCAVFWLIFHNRRNLKRVFQPRTELAADGKRPEELPSGIFAYWKHVFQHPDREILRVNGPDAYFFVRYCKVFGLQMMVPYVILTFAACVPAAAIKPNSNLGGVNTLTLGNVPPTHTLRTLAHMIVAVILMVWTLYLIWREYNHYMDVRTQWLKSDSTSLKSRTVAMVNVPEDMFSEAGIRELGGMVGQTPGPRPSVATDGAPPLKGSGTVTAGGITHVWLGVKVKKLESAWEDRDKECLRLEGGVGKLLKQSLKNQRKGKTPEKKGTFSAESATHPADKYILPKKQPTWKQGLLGLFGKKMTLETSPVYIREKNEEVASLRSAGDFETGNVAFARFATREQAHHFARNAKNANKSLRLLETSVEVVPDDIVWSNVSINPYQRKIGSIVSWALTIGLIIVWAIPVAFVGAVSNIDTLQKNKPFAWIGKIPSIPLGIIKSILPTVLLAVLFMLLPIVLRMWIKYAGEIRKSEIELKLFTRFWVFWIIHGFLIVTLSSGLMAALGNLGKTLNDVPTLLATQLPGASIFFLTFVLTATWAAAAKSLARIMPFVMYQLRGFLAGGTPRKAFQQKYKLDSFQWSTTWPNVCLILAVMIIYSVIQPLITVVGIVAFLLFYMAYKYTLIWVADQDDTYETGGRYYIKALRTIFVALYFEQICLAGLFFLQTSADKKRTKNGIASGVIIAVLCGFTAIFQAWIDHVKFKKITLLHGWESQYGHTSSETALNPPNEKLGYQATPVATNNSNATNRAEAEAEAMEEKHAFDHPALWKKQPTIWIADDPLGLGRHESQRINAAGVESSTEYAHMNEKGDVWVDRGPPDEPWEGGVV